VRHVLALSTLYPNAAKPGFGGFVARSMAALAARGDWRVSVIAPIGAPPFAPGRYAELAEAATDGLENGVHVYRPRFTLIPKVGARLNPSMIARSVLPLARRLHAEVPFDLIEAQFFYPDGPAAARIAAALGIPLSIKARGGDIHYWGTQPHALRRMREAAQHAAGLLAVSEALRRDMIALGLPADRIAVHYTGLDRARFKPMARAEARATIAALGLPGTGPLLVSVGALTPRKGQNLAVHALEGLPGVHLALVGAGPEEPALRKLVAESGLSDRVHFLGQVAHDVLPALLSAADAMVLPSASEGLANAWIEALACGTPLVISDVGGAREVVTGRDAGRLVARDPGAIGAAVRELLAAPPAPEAVAEIAARFSWDGHAVALAEYYQGLLARR